MAADVTRGQRIGNVLTWEVDGNKHGFCRKAFATVSVETGMEVGSCLDSSGDWIDGATTAGGDTTMIVIDETIYDKTVGSDYELAVLYKGPATVAKNALSFNNTVSAGNLAATVTALAALDIDATDSIA